MTPFAAVPYPTLDLHLKNGPLQTALEQSIAEVAALNRLGPNQKVAFSILAFAKDGHHKYAGVNDDTMHYSGSLLKVAAMYAAHELLAAADRLARTPGPHRANPAAFFSGLETKFDPQIKATAVPDALKAAEDLAAKLPAYRSTPTYTSLFEVTGTGGTSAPSVDFTADFTTQMTKMIEVSDNHAAGECIRRLSYSYVNAALMKAGFYTASPSRGIWFAGDYTLGANPYARVASENDGLAAQVTTAKQITRMFALIELNKLITQDGNNARMKTLLGMAAALGGWFHFAPLSPPPNQPFTLTLSKIGRGPLKAGGETFSEGQVLQWNDAAECDAKGLKREIAVCWQNMHLDKIRGIVDVVGRTYTKFLA